MANAEHLAILNQGVEAWNQWRGEYSSVVPDLSGADLSKTTLNCADFDKTCLVGANLCGVNLSHAFLNGAFLYGLNLSKAILTHAELRQADLREADLIGADLTRANLIYANLVSANLTKANFTQACLEGVSCDFADCSKAIFDQARLCGGYFVRTNFFAAKFLDTALGAATLNEASFRMANLQNADLSRAQASGTSFEQAVLTGACIKDLNYNRQTVWHEAVCEHVYFDSIWVVERLEYAYLERRPCDPNKTFAPGEFISLVQKSLSTVDLIFTDGIDWRAFFSSFQDLQARYADRHLSIQAIERKDYAFIIRLEVDSDADKGAIESSGMALYAEQVKQCERIIDLQGQQLDDYRNLLKEQRWQNIELTGAVKTLAEQQPKNTIYNQHGAKFGNFAADGGMAIGGTFNDFSQNIEQNLSEIDRLVRSLHSLTQTLPAAQQTEAIEHLSDLQAELKTPDKRKPSRLKASLAALLVIGGAIAGTTDFANNVYELSDKLGVPLERVQPAQQPSTVDVPVIKLESK